MTRGYDDHRCARSLARLYLLREQSPDGKLLTYTDFVPVQGRGREVLRMNVEPGGYSWDLSPDGSRIAMLFKAGGNVVRILTVAGGRHSI